MASFVPSADSVTLCTHGTIGYAKYVYEYANNWKGPISVSFIVDENGFTSLAAYKLLYNCDRLMKKFVTTHIVWRETAESPCDPTFITNNIIDLRPYKCDIGEYEKISKHSLNIPYPPNTLRNIARSGASTNIHLIADIENHFSKNAKYYLNLVAPKVTKENVIAIRRFEYDVNEKEPETPKILKEMLKTEKGSTWEPQLMIHASHPYHFEGAPIRLADQQMLPYELCRANVKFNVVSHVFSFHKGIKRSNTAAELEPREKLIHQGDLVTAYFLKHLRQKYPNFEQSCGEWEENLRKGFLHKISVQILSFFY
uniref:Glycosyltransferase family 92 protein n=1 Tax=Panagrolaimus superbus TaxID=310955 RepID=A0A914YPK3_9BILA